MARIAGDVDDESEGSTADTAADLAAETAAGAAGGRIDPLDAYFDVVDEQIERLSGTVLKPRLDALEADRRRVRGYITKSVIVAAIPLVLFFISGLLQAPLMPHYDTSPTAKFLMDWWTELLIALEVLGLVFIGFVYVMPGLVAHLEYRRKFKQTVATEIFKALVPDGTYQPDHHLSQKAVDESGLISEASYSIWPARPRIRSSSSTSRSRPTRSSTRRSMKRTSRTRQGRRRRTRASRCRP